jgi:hypothetical protein
MLSYISLIKFSYEIPQCLRVHGQHVLRFWNDDVLNKSLECLRSPSISPEWKSGKPHLIFEQRHQGLPETVYAAGEHTQAGDQPHDLIVSGSQDEQPFKGVALEEVDKELEVHK